MADQVTNYQCPACTGPLHFDGKIGKLKCDYCGSSFTVQEVEKLYAAKNASAVSAKEAADKKAEKEAAEAAAFQNEMQAAAGGVKPEAAEGAEAASGWGSDAAKMRAYNCTSDDGSDTMPLLRQQYDYPRPVCRYAQARLCHSF